MHEIIHVIDPSSLVGAHKPGLEIEAVNGQALAAGYYFVLWPTRLSDKQGKRYFGPFATLIQARMVQRSALALGLVSDDKTIQSIKPITECRSIARPPLMTPSSPWFPSRSAGVAPGAAARAA